VQGNSQNEVWRLLNSCCEVQSTSNEWLLKQVTKGPSL
jgi:hypothetical protein